MRIRYSQQVTHFCGKSFKWREDEINNPLADFCKVKQFKVKATLFCAGVVIPLTEVERRF